MWRDLLIKTVALVPVTNSHGLSLWNARNGMGPSTARMEIMIFYFVILARSPEYPQRIRVASVFEPFICCDD